MGCGVPGVRSGTVALDTPLRGLQRPYSTRALPANLLQRLDMPALDPTPDRPGPDTERSLQALKAADRRDWGPLVAIWRGRFEKEADA